MKMTDKEWLLNNVLRDESYAAFRDGLLEEILADLRRQRAAGKRSRWLALAACLPIAAIIYLLLPPHAPRADRPSATVAVVRTMPLAPDQIVTTRAETSVSATQPKVLVVATKEGDITIVQTAGHGMELLTDGQLLDLFKGHPVALVTLGAGERRLLLPDESEPLW